MKAETIAKALSGRKAGGAWMACCPAHEDRAPSLFITDVKGGKVLVRCLPVAISSMLSRRFARAAFGRPKADSKADPLTRTAAGLPPRPIRTP